MNLESLCNSVLKKFNSQCCHNLWKRLEGFTRMVKTHNLYQHNIQEFEFLLGQALELKKLMMLEKWLNPAFATFEDVLDFEQEFKARIFSEFTERDFSWQLKKILSCTLKDEVVGWNANLSERENHIHAYDLVEDASEPIEALDEAPIRKRKSKLTAKLNKRSRIGKKTRRDHHLDLLKMCANVVCETSPNSCTLPNLYTFLHSEEDDISLSIKLNLAIGIASGLTSIHQLQFMHGNLTSRCVLLEKGYVPLISGFDPQKMGMNNQLAGKVDQGDSPIVYWQAPESFQQERLLSDKSDVWALGVILWEVFTGGIPFGGEADISAVMERIKRGEAPGKLEGMEEGLVNLLRSCWNLNPIERPSSQQVLNNLKLIRKERNSWLMAAKTKIDPYKFGFLELFFADGPKLKERKESHELLIHCVRKQALFYLDWFIKTQGCSVHGVDENGNNLLHLAALEGDVPIFAWLVKETDIDHLAVNKAGDTPLSIIQTKEYTPESSPKCSFLHRVLIHRNLDLFKWLFFNANLDEKMASEPGKYAQNLFKGFYSMDIANWLMEQDNSNIYKAIQEEDFELVKQIVSNNKIDIEVRHYNGTPLYIAISKGNLEIVKLLVLEGKADVDSLDSSALHLAAELGNFEILKFLVLECGAQVGRVNGGGMTPLENAANKGQLDVVKWFIEDLQIDLEGSNPLHHAAKGGHIEIVKYLVLDCKMDVNQKTKNQIATPFMYCGAESTPLHQAAMSGHLNVAKWLIREGKADPELCNLNGLTPLSLAVVYNKFDMVKWMVTSGRIDVNRQDMEGLSPLHRAIKANRLQIAKWLVIEGRVDVNLPSNDGLSPIVLALRYTGIDFARFLVETGKADVDQASKDGNIPLDQLKSWLSKEKTRYSVFEGVAINFRNMDGDAPFDIAARTDNHNAARSYLEDVGAHPFSL